MDHQAVDRIMRAHAAWRRTRLRGLVLLTCLTGTVLGTLVQIAFPNPFAIVQGLMAGYLWGMVKPTSVAREIGRRTLWRTISALLLADACEEIRPMEPGAVPVLRLMAEEPDDMDERECAAYLANAMRALDGAPPKARASLAAHIALLAHAVRPGAFTRATRRIRDAIHPNRRQDHDAAHEGEEGPAETDQPGRAVSVTIEFG